MNERPLVYLACPYWPELPSCREARFHQANQAAAKLMAQGVLVFSPISHTHPIAEDGDLPTDWGFWSRYCRAVLACCGKVIVLCLPGWDSSTRVRAEIRIAKEMKIPVEYLYP